jgi:hypothetical protein
MTEYFNSENSDHVWPEGELVLKHTLGKKNIAGKALRHYLLKKKKGSFIPVVHRKH